MRREANMSLELRHGRTLGALCLALNGGQSVESPFGCHLKCERAEIWVVVAAVKPKMLKLI